MRGQVLIRMPLSTGAKWGLGMMARFFSPAIAVLACASAIATAASAAPFTINDAIRMAVQTNPIVGEDED